MRRSKRRKILIVGRGEVVGRVLLVGIGGGRGVEEEGVE